MSDKPKFPAKTARAVAERYLPALSFACEPRRCCVAGSLRRGQAEVGDLEIIFVPKTGMSAAGEMFERPVNLMERALADLTALHVLAPRKNALGRTTWGELIKLAVDLETGLPVDFFTATQDNWWNYLVCRTGPRESNEAIARAAQARGLKWKPYSRGFCAADDPHEEIVVCVNTEAGVFETVGLPYHEPEDRR